MSIFLGMLSISAFLSWPFLYKIGYFYILMLKYIIKYIYIYFTGMFQSSYMDRRLTQLGTKGSTPKTPDARHYQAFDIGSSGGDSASRQNVFAQESQRKHSNTIEKDWGLKDRGLVSEITRPKQFFCQKFIGTPRSATSNAGVVNMVQSDHVEQKECQMAYYQGYNKAREEMRRIFPIGKCHSQINSVTGGEKEDVEYRNIYDDRNGSNLNGRK